MAGSPAAGGVEQGNDQHQPSRIEGGCFRAPELDRLLGEAVQYARQQAGLSEHRVISDERHGGRERIGDRFGNVILRQTPQLDLELIHRHDLSKAMRRAGPETLLSHTAIEARAGLWHRSVSRIGDGMTTTQAQDRKNVEPTSELRTGLSGTVEIVVGTRDTAPHVGSGRIKVLATPVMVNLMEEAALIAVEGLLPEGYQTVGTRLDISHTKATPVGLTVTAGAELLRVDGRRLTFRVWAKDESERIGEGFHERIVVNVARLDSRAQQKMPKR